MARSALLDLDLLSIGLGSSCLFDVREQLLSKLLELRVVLQDFMGLLEALYLLCVALKPLINGTLEVVVATELSLWLLLGLLKFLLDGNAAIDAG